MILPFSSNRSRTSLSSNCLYCASFTPRAMFSKSMNIASFRSPFIRKTVLSRSAIATALETPHPLYVPAGRPRERMRYIVIGRPGSAPPGALEVTHDAARSLGGDPDPTGADPDHQVARAHLRAHAPFRPAALDLPLLRAGG